jgi:hypothetical protein
MNEEKKEKLDLPTAEELDSRHVKDRSWTCRLYLVPAEETNTGRPRVELFAGVGNIGTPMMAFHHRWLALGSYGPQVVGESVHEQLIEASEWLLLGLAASYQGKEWDGSNYRGRWDWDLDLRDMGNFPDPLCLRHYFDAYDWFGDAEIDWVDLCDEAEIDPERALDADWEDVAEKVGEKVEPLQDEEVSGTAEYAREMAKRFRKEHAEQEEEESDGQPQR